MALYTRAPEEPSSEIEPPPRSSAKAAPRVDAFRSVVRHPFVALMPVVLFLVAALAIGLTRAPVYTAEARLTVGGVDFSAPGALSGFATASQSLAATYARAIDSREVVDKVYGSAGRRAAVDDLVATPLPDSPVIRVIAESGSSARAQKLANLASGALAEFASKLNSADAAAAGDSVYEQYKDAAHDLQEAQLRRDQAAKALKADDSRANEDELVKTRTAVTTAALRQQSLAANYLTTTSGRVAVAQVQPLTEAQTASNDRFRRLQLYILVALIAGCLAGVARATARANWLAHRRFRD